MLKSKAIKENEKKTRQGKEREENKLHVCATHNELCKTS